MLIFLNLNFSIGFLGTQTDFDPESADKARIGMYHGKSLLHQLALSDLSPCADFLRFLEVRWNHKISLGD